MILYFNTKIISGSIYEFNKNSYYPILMPKDYIVQNKYRFNFNILKETIKSYSKIDFEYGIFNIELENQKDEKEILDIISKSFSKIKTEIRFTRPSNKKSWQDDIKRLSIFKNKPIFTVFNHDHILLDHQLSTFDSIIKEVFKGNNTDFKKIFFYSHGPEIMSKILINKIFRNIKVIKRKSNIYSLKYLNTTIDAFVIMSYDTLNYIFKNITKHPKYIGRIDWQGLYFNKLGIEAFVYPREFFGHYEGYGHVTGTRIYKNLNIEKYIEKLSDNEILDYYYSKWLNISFLFIRDYMRIKIFNSRKNYQKAIEISINLFKKTYLDEDFKHKTINKTTYEMLLFNFRSKIYHNSNEIYTHLKIDNELGFDRLFFLKEFVMIKLKNSFVYRGYIKFFK